MIQTVVGVADDVTFSNCITSGYIDANCSISFRSSCSGCSHIYCEICNVIVLRLYTGFLARLINSSAKPRSRPMCMPGYFPCGGLLHAYMGSSREQRALSLQTLQTEA